MSLLKDHYTSKDYWDLPECERAELIDGKFYDMAPPSRRLDYGIKNGIYSQSGVREYWIVDPAKKRVTVYHYEVDVAPVIYSFDQDVPVGIYPGLTICMRELLKNY